MILEQFIFVASATAQALPIVPDGSTATQITQTASGIDQINIASPNANGLSHNKFDEYNVNVAGQIINNFSGNNPVEINAGSGANAVTQTQIGGLVIANPNLNQTGSANIILNEVTSGNVSQLLGYTEIAGTKADLILANPNGIACKGCGFINTARLLMVAGKSDFDANGNLGFNLKEQIDPNLYVPLITIDGLGLDATRVAGTEIIASSVKLLASIYGNENNSLMIKTGDGKYDYASKNIDSINSDNVNPNSQTSPIFAIDASALAKIQAGQIYLIATKRGVGVQMANEILASQTLNLEANGDIYYQDIAVGGEANLKSSGTIQNIDSNASILAPNVHIQADNFNNSALISAYNLNIKNGENLTNSGNLEALNLTFANINNINNSGSIFGQNNLEISGQNLLNNLSGNIHSPQSYSINLTGLLSNSGLISSENNLNIQANQLTNNSEISAGNFSANSASFYNSGTIYSANNFNINNIFDLTNSGTLYSAGNFTISSKEIFNNDSAWIYGNKNVSLITNFDFNNFGNLQTNADLVLSIGNNTKNSGVITGKQITLNNVGDIANSGSIGAENNINLSAKDLANSGLIKSLGNSNFNLNDNFINQLDATIYVGENLTLNVKDSLNNSGEISALGSSHISSNNITNSNKILSNGALSVSANSLTNNYFSTIASLADDLNFTVNDDFINDGQISSTKDLAIFAKNFTNSGDVLSGAKLITTIANQITNSGNLQSVNDFSLNTQILENYGSIRVFGESLINADSINNQSNSLIFFNSNSIINSANSFINSGTILANEKLDLNANFTTNLGEIFSAKDLKLNLSNSFTNVGTLSSLGSLDITSNSSIINNNQILSDRNLNISAINLNNADKIQANGDIALNVVDLTNANKIISGGNFNITTAGNVANNGNLESADNFAINANKLTNSQFAIILANNNLTLQALSIENQNTKPLNSIITSGIVSNFGVVNILTDNLNNNSGLIASKATTLNALTDTSVNLDNSFGAFVSTEEINLNLGALDYTITGNITASNIDITANNIFNRGNVTASDFIKLNATGSIGNSGGGTIVNGVANGDNSNILLASGSYINFLAKNNIENYATILGSTDLTLTSTYGNINNYNNGKITTGSGLATINAINGAFNNNAKTAIFTANNNAIFNAKNLNNFGEISIANDLTTNITNNLTNNPTSLIWSGRDAIFNVANIFLNNQADIYADRNLTIQKNTSLDPAQNKTNLVQNISGNIETYSGDIKIKAVTLENKRSSMKTQGGDYVYGQAYVRGGDCHRNWRGKKKCNPIIYRDLHAANIYGIAGLEASVLSGGGINITANNFLNDASSIISSANFGINASNFNNNSYSFVQYNDNYRNYEYYTSFIKSGGALTITQNGALKPSLINGSNVASFVAGVGNSKQVQSTKINHIDNFQLAKTGILAVDLSSIIKAINNGNVDDLNLANPQINNLQIDKTDIVAPTSTPNSSNIILAGNFKINLDSSATTPLVESRSQFTDASKFFGSSYYFEKLGLNKPSTRILGDAFIENKLILDQLRILTNDSLFLNKNINNSNLQIKELLDNSIEAFLALGLDPKEVALNGLTQDQINSLTKNIITFEATKVNGISVLAPKIYLTRETRNRLFNANPLTGGKALANSSTLFAKENLTIDSPNAQLLNNGSIVSDLNLTLNLDSLENKTKVLAQAQIIAGNNLAITAQNGDIKNIGAKMASNFALSLSASNGNILNSAIVQTNDQNLLNQNPDSYQLAIGDIAKSSGNITSTLLHDASFKGGSIAINAGGDFNNLGATISTVKNISADGLNTSSGNIAITAGGDINIATLQLRNREETKWGSRKKGGTLVVDETKNFGSDIESAGSLSLRTTGVGVDLEMLGNPQVSNIQITGSNLKSSENISIASKDDIIIQASQDSFYQSSQSWKKGLTVAKNSVSGSESLTNNLSTLTSDGNIIFTSSSDTNLIGTKLKADNIAIDAGAEINIYSVSDYNKTWTSSTKSRNYSSLTGGMVGATALATVEPTTLVGAGVLHLGLDTNNSLKSSSNSTEKTLNIASIIEAKNNIALNSNQDLTISGSDISGKTGSLISNQGSVNIVSAIEIEKNISSNKSVERATNAPGFKGSKNSSNEYNETVKNIASNLSFADSLLIKTDGNSLDPMQLADVNIKGSNLTVSNGDLTIASKGNVIIENAIDSKFKEFSGKKSNETTKNKAKTVDYVETASSSNLNADNINISSLGDTVIQGSNIKTQENLLIGSFAVAQNSDGTYQKDANGNYITTTGSAVDNLIIKDAELREYHYAQKTKGFTGIVGVQVRALPYAFAQIEIAVDLTKEALGTFLPQNYENFILDDLKIGEVFNGIDKVKNEIGNIKISETSQERIDKTNSIASNLDVNGSMMINSVGNTLIKGSNLDISGDLLANSLGSFEVVASKNTESKTIQESYETAGEFHSDYKPSKANYRAGVAKDFVEEGLNSSSSSLVSSNINIGGSALINSSDKFSLIASNLISNDSIEIIAKNNLNISDAKNTKSVSSYQEKITLDTGVQVGNAYADAGNAVIDTYKATKEVKDSYDKLEKIKDLKDQGMASSKAVERAEYQVYLALINAGLSSANAMQAVANAGVAASTSLFTGFYGSIYADISKLKSTSTTESSQSISSNLIANNSINLASGNGDINIIGSNVSSTNSDINLNSMLGNINIEAGESTYSQSSKSNSRNLGGSVGTNGLSANIGFNESQNSLDQTTFANSQISAINGNLNINTKQDLKIFGANLLSKNVNLNIGNNFLLKSRQNLSESDSYNIGASIGISGDSSGVNGGSLGLNLGNGYSNKAWVDQVSSIIGTNSVNIDVANDTNIASALIANQNNQGIDLGNLTLKTKSLTYSDLNNFSVSESNQLSTNLQAGYNPNNPTQNGNLAIKLNMQGSESSSITRTTIGKGNITINEILNDESKIANLNRDINNIEQNKKNIITSDFDSEIKIDLRLIASAGNLMIGNTDKATANWNSYATQTVDGAKIAYKFTPTNVNKEIEKFRGSEQSWGWGNNAVYKSGDEPNGVRDEFANNVGMANVPMKDGKLDISKVGTNVEFDLTNTKGLTQYIGGGTEGGLVSQTCSYAVPGCNDMSLTHDNLAGQLKKNYPEIPTLITNQGTIIPAYIINSYGLIGKPINDFIEYLQTPSYTINLELPKNPIQIPTLLSPSFNQNLQQQ